MWPATGGHGKPCRWNCRHCLSATTGAALLSSHRLRKTVCCSDGVRSLEVPMTHYVLTMSTRQAGVLLRSTELAAALGIGRLRDITSAPLPVRDLATRDELRRRLEALEPCVTGHGANIWLSISAPQVHDDAKIG